MASPMQLVECVAVVLGVPYSKVVSVDRELVASGLRTKGGRGRAAARMTARDAANLLIAVAGAEQVLDSVGTVETFAGLLAERPGAPLRNLGVDHTFGEALTAVINGFADDSFHYADGVWVQVTLERPIPKASILLELGNPQQVNNYRLPPGRRSLTGDLETLRRFNRPTLQTVAHLLRG